MNHTIIEARRASASLPRAVLRASVLVTAAVAAAFSQGIRKNYTEMTTDEKNALVAAFQTLGDPANGLLRDLASFHSNNFPADAGGIHQASTEANNVFHAWHRYASFELEQRMQQINPHITLPYWDWTVNTSPTDALWDNAFLGGFNARWSLNRRLSGSLPTAADVAAVQSLTSWWGPGGVSGSGYSQRVENATPVHNSPHIWVGGVMAGGGSPLDPVFWLHHNNVDRLWNSWERQEEAFKTSHTKTNMPRYNGTYVRPDGVTLPSVDPDNIRDSHAALGVFYCQAGWAFLNGYTVANRYRTPEQFTYQYMVRAINFTVPAGKSVALRSATGIELMNNVEVQSGGSFVAEVKATGSLVAKTGVDEMEAAPPQEPSEPIVEAGNRFNFRTEGANSRLSLEFPGWIPKANDIEGEVWDMAGKRSVLRLLNVEGVYLIHGLTFDLSGVETRGVHFFRVRAGKERFAGRVVLGNR